MRRDRGRARRTLTVTLTVGLTLALGVTACSGDDGDGVTDAAEPTQDVKTPKGADPRPDATEDPTKDPAEDPSDDGAGGPASGDAACLEGRWQADTEGQIATMREVLAETGTVLDVTVTGTSTTEYAGGRVTTTYDNQVMTTTMDISGQQLVSTTTYDGTTSASFTVLGDRVLLSAVETDELTLDVQNTIDGAVLDMGDYASSMLSAMAIGGTMEFTCSGDTLVMTPTGPGMDLSSYAVEMRRLP